MVWAWRDLVMHWTRAQPDGARLWPFWLALTVAAFALLDGVSLAFDVEEVRGAALLDPRVVALFEIVTKAGKSDWLFALSILTMIYALVPPRPGARFAHAREIRPHGLAGALFLHRAGIFRNSVAGREASGRTRAAEADRYARRLALRSVFAQGGAGEFPLGSHHHDRRRRRQPELLLAALGARCFSCCRCRSPPRA